MLNLAICMRNNKMQNYEEKFYKRKNSGRIIDELLNNCSLLALKSADYIVEKYRQLSLRIWLMQ